MSVLHWTDDCSTSSSTEFKVSQTKGMAPLTKSVHFAEDKNEVFPVIHLNDIPEKEVEAIWYTAEEYSEIKASYQITIFMMEAGDNVENDGHTSRGLEYRTQEGAWARYENKRDAYNAVLDEQDRQWKVDKDDFEQIRNIYCEHSTKCSNAAVMRALKDMQEAIEYLKDSPENPCLLEKKKKKKKYVDDNGYKNKEGGITEKPRKSKSSEEKKKSKSSTEEKKTKKSSSSKSSSSGEKKKSTKSCSSSIGTGESSLDEGSSIALRQQAAELTKALEVRIKKSSREVSV